MTVTNNSPNVESSSEIEIDDITIVVNSADNMGPIDNYSMVDFLPSVSPNILRDFDSVTYMFKFAAVPRNSYNEASYLADDSALQYIILSSSGDPTNRATTIYGSPEYYIENFKMTHMMPGNPNSRMTGLIGASFDVHEPYSLGIFFESLTSSARKAGYLNFNDEAPFVMRIDFLGWKNGQSKKLPQATRFIPLRLTKIDFSADTTGSNYQVRAVSFGSLATSNEYGAIRRVTSFSGRTVLDALETGLAVALNADQEYLKSTGMIGEKDEYSILYSTDAEAVSVPGWQDAGFPAGPGSSGSPPQVSEAADGNPTENPIGPDYQVKQFSFHPGDSNREQTIQSIIEEVMLASTYIKTSLQNISTVDGTINWFMIRPRIELTNRRDVVRNVLAKKVIFEVRPYRVRADFIKHPNKPNWGTDQIMKKIRKVYSYLYTGQDAAGRQDEVISFDLSFNNTFYVAGQVAPTQNVNPNTTGEPGVTGSSSVVTGGSSAVEPTQNYPFIPSNQSRLQTYGGANITEHDVQVAQSVYNAITGGDGYAQSDLIMVNLGILGDPYYIPVSGVGNQTLSVSPANEYSTNREAMYWEGATVRIYLRFRSVVDAPSYLRGQSMYQVPYGGLQDSPYSGIYSILSVESNFQKGLFTQTLKLARDFRPAARNAMTGFDSIAPVPPWALEEVGVAPRNDSIINSQIPAQGTEPGGVPPPSPVTETYLNDDGTDSGISVVTGDRSLDRITQTADRAIDEASVRVEGDDLP